MPHGPARTVMDRLVATDGADVTVGPLAIPGDGEAVAVEQWHPKIRRFFDYWKSKQPPEGLPGRRHIDPVELRDLLPMIWMLDVQQDPFRLRYRLVGTGIADAMGRDHTGRWLDEVHPQAATDPLYLERYRTTVATGISSWRRGAPRMWFNEEHRLIENLVLPLAADGVTVDMLIILTIMYWRRDLI